MGVTPSQTIASTFRELDHKQFAKMETPFSFIPDQSPMKAHDCGNEDTPQNSVNLMNILREYPAKYTFSKVLDHKEPVPTV